ncbi:flagellar protein [Thermosipho melanesiensis]|uniref:Flagellar protein n=1 Tax=Thermosipho melanesiensis TaxID=46541 RepID=A0ABM6GFK7_9BACT|nr:flagellar FlbD family protein [Thermosipho melanesiensis]APT74233.1 flagellar protein [Thermosipho melanesiensis]OOC36791.1 flagellar protein [Thermosipho melanesiensis]OOC37328.1 flagellar protein [Thermosipho melanesiensis]OOC38080.1 flagellar protein [Thermosipho melanesiensis]OOC41309.1 flagellar protein [Thermosipho melanesiensis]
MILLTYLNKKKFYLNADYIEKIESLPDTTITLYNGKKYIVLETAEEVIEKVIEYKKEVLSIPPLYKDGEE